MNWINQRRKEPTTYLGLSAFIYGLMTLLKADGAEVVSQTIESAAQPLANGDYAQTVTLVLGGLLGMLMKEKAE